MSFGLQAINGDRIVNIDGTKKSFVYLGRYDLPAFTAGIVEITVSCAGRPFVFVNVPPVRHGENGEYGDGNIILGMRDGGVNLWVVSVMSVIASLSASDISSLRVFGRADLNPAGGGGYGMQVFDETGDLCFDGSLPMLRLKGNTIGRAITIDGTGGDPRGGRNAVDIGFDLTNTSCSTSALTRCIELFSTTFLDVDNQPVTDVDTYAFARGLSFSGTTLIADWCNYYYLHSQGAGGGASGINYKGGSVSTTVAFIDNALFP